VITSVVPGTDAAEKGLAEGQIVGQINQRPVTTVEQVTALVENARENGRAIVLVTINDPTGGTRFIPVHLNK
jgi:serine protease Do